MRDRYDHKHGAVVNKIIKGYTGNLGCELIKFIEAEKRQIKEIQ